MEVISFRSQYQKRNLNTVSGFSLLKVDSVPNHFFCCRQDLHVTSWSIPCHKFDMSFLSVRQSTALYLLQRACVSSIYSSGFIYFIWFIWFIYFSDFHYATCFICFLFVALSVPCFICFYITYFCWSPFWIFTCLLVWFFTRLM